MASSDDALDAYAQGVWDAVAYINEWHMSERHLLRWDEVLEAIEKGKQEDGRS